MTSVKYEREYSNRVKVKSGILVRRLLFYRVAFVQETGENMCCMFDSTREAQ